MNQVDDRQLARMEAIINSMTPKERRFPNIIKGSRKRRIAAGSGTSVAEVNRVLKSYSAMLKMLKKMRGKPGAMVGKKRRKVPKGMRR